MLAAVFHGNKNIVLRDYSLRTIEKNELLIKVACCGVCGTDRHIYEGKAPSIIPVILGHEFSGTIIEKGDSNSKFNIGDNVAINPNIYCGHCDYCRKGMVSFCENLKALGVSIDGGFAEYSIVPASQCYILPPDFDLSIAAFAEPLSCCLRGIENADIKPGNTAVIIGGGSIGLLMVQLVRNSGASKIILVEPDSYKQKLGIELGADYTLNPYNEKIFEEIKELTNSQVDIVIECVGSADSVDKAIQMTGKGGKVVIFGLAPKEQNVTLNLQYLFHNELKILSSFLNPFTFKSAIDLLMNKKIKVQELITQQIYLKDMINIFSGSNISNSIKVQIINN
ncbi:MAG: zinc-dependent alcohol dehydrogenase family protein [Ignavibacteriaceae bacterium]|jgi:2-desacetyl-2-hydroxyethyl bacteriochlorophyllide A dehydrogenase|nr:zinc-dependent alcohol dehydrogenase family protein [Ignavibacteriaceae bacterium]